MGRQCNTGVVAYTEVSETIAPTLLFDFFYFMDFIIYVCMYIQCTTRMQLKFLFEKKFWYLITAEYEWCIKLPDETMHYLFIFNSYQS